MKKGINEYNEFEVRMAYQGIKLGLNINSDQPLVIEKLIKALEELKIRAKELGITLV